jgi:peptidylprolyl isomerase/FKBP-type peptidyl-prolyl cis-trans isomerase FkpA
MQNQKGSTSVVVSFIIVIAAVGLMVYALSHKKQDANTEVDMAQNAATEQNTINNNESAKPAEKKSMEQIAKKGDVLSMNYTGRLQNGTVFDSNVDPKFNHVEPFEFTLGAGQVIAGWDEGLVGMKVGEKKTLTITPDKGYGARAVGSIPANSTLIFDVELVAIK